jgi:DNA-binding CsgD family transcriptional regulator
MTMDPTDEHVVDPFHTIAASAPAARMTMPHKAKPKTAVAPTAAHLMTRVRAKVEERATPVLSQVDAGSFRRELLRGEWSLLDHFDRDGIRYFTWARGSGRGDQRRSLTKREQDVLERVATGQSDRSIAMELRCSSSTVATHRLRAMSKLGLRSRALFSQILASVATDEGQ